MGVRALAVGGRQENCWNCREIPFFRGRAGRCPRGWGSVLSAGPRSLVHTLKIGDRVRLRNMKQVPSTCPRAKGS